VRKIKVKHNDRQQTTRQAEEIQGKSDNAAGFMLRPTNIKESQYDWRKEIPAPTRSVRFPLFVNCFSWYIFVLYYIILLCSVFACDFGRF
jgi:hypothetical protein